MIVIDSEFQSLISPLSDDEYDHLEKSILAEGLREPIITWNGTIIDGHNRYNICDEHGIPFTQVEREFESRDAAKIWIIENQFGRRNLNPSQKMELSRKLEPLYAAEARKRHSTSTGGATPQLVENLPQAAPRTRDQLAVLAGVSGRTFDKYMAIADKADNGDPVATKERQDLLSGKKKSIHGAYIRVTGDKKPRSAEESTAPDGRRICAMCGEPIDEGEAHPARPTVHKKCEQEYQRDWERDKRKQKFTEDGRRICSLCGEPIDEGDAYDHEPALHKRCRNKKHAAAQHSYRNPTIGDTSEVLTHDKAELRNSLLLVVQDIGDTLLATINRYETMDVKLSKAEQERIIKSLDALTSAVKRIKE